MLDLQQVTPFPATGISPTFFSPFDHITHLHIEPTKKLRK